jgi:hypothetical protein
MVYTSMYEFRKKGSRKGAGSTRKNGSPEHDIQVYVVDYLEAMETVPLFSATVGGVRVAMHTALKMKQAGYRKGIPDLLIFEPRNGYAGLAIEVKTAVGRASDHQKEWQQMLRERGWRAEICKGLDACISVIDDYFSDSTKVL